MATIIDGKAISMQIKDECKEKVAKLKSEGKSVALAVIQVGEAAFWMKKAESVFEEKLATKMFLRNFKHRNRK